MIIQCDFDGTIIKNNLSVLLREKYACDGWQDIESSYLNGRLSVEQSNKLQFALIKEPKAKLQQFVRHHMELRAGFPEFVRQCRNTGTSLVIVSSGLDFYIEPVLDQINTLDLELHCGQASFDKNGIDVAYFDPEGNIINVGFKKKYLRWLKKRDKNIIYIGDGLSDLDAARRADHVFATGHLVTLLEGKSANCHVFSDFYDILKLIHFL